MSLNSFLTVSQKIYRRLQRQKAQQSPNVSETTAPLESSCSPEALLAVKSNSPISTEVFRGVVELVEGKVRGTYRSCKIL